MVTLGQAFDQSSGALVATRFVVGIFDAGLIPSCAFVLYLYYLPRRSPSMAHEYVDDWKSSLRYRWQYFDICHCPYPQLQRVSRVEMVSEIHTHPHDKTLGPSKLDSFPRICIVEGSLTTTIGLICCLSKASQPATAEFLSKEEKEVIALNVEASTTTISIFPNGIFSTISGPHYTS